MNWFNWHEPAITAAQAAYAIGGVIVLNVIISIGSALMRRPEPVKPDTEDDIVGDYPHMDRGGL